MLVPKIEIYVLFSHFFQLCSISVQSKKYIYLYIRTLPQITLETPQYPNI